MPLFDDTLKEVSVGYANLRTGKSPQERSIRDGLEKLWEIYEPYADTDFRQSFALDPDAHFWEMYLATRLIELGKNIRPRSELKKALKDEGPDICIVGEGNPIWIEAVTPDRGNNPDRVPEFVGKRTLYAAPRGNVELRITNSLLNKRAQFRRHREKGIVGNGDIAIVAINGSRMWAQSSTLDMPHPVTAVYPIGDEYIIADRRNPDIVYASRAYSDKIPRKLAGEIARTAFLSGEYAEIAGLIWSRRTMGNFQGQDDDLVFVHNLTSEHPLPPAWIPWKEEYLIEASETEYVCDVRRR